MVWYFQRYMCYNRCQKDSLAFWDYAIPGFSAETGPPFYLHGYGKKWRFLFLTFCQQNHRGMMVPQWTRCSVD